MAMGYKTGGRQKGTPNKNRAVLIERLSERFPNYDPVIALAELAQDASVENLPQLALKGKVFDGWLKPPPSGRRHARRASGQDG